VLQLLGVQVFRGHADRRVAFKTDPYDQLVGIGQARAEG
jgi:hypothetical protein